MPIKRKSIFITYYLLFIYNLLTSNQENYKMSTTYYKTLKKEHLTNNKHSADSAATVTYMYACMNGYMVTLLILDKLLV